MLVLKALLDLLGSLERPVQPEPREETEYQELQDLKASKGRKDSRACRVTRGHQEQMVFMGPEVRQDPRVKMESLEPRAHQDPEE